MPMQWFTSIINLQFNLATKTNRKDSLKIMLCIKSVGFPGGASGEEPTCQCRRHRRCGFIPWVGKIPWRRAWQPTPVFLPGGSHGQRSLVGYSPWDRTLLSGFSLYFCTKGLWRILKVYHRNIY